MTKPYKNMVVISRDLAIEIRSTLLDVQALQEKRQGGPNIGVFDESIQLLERLARGLGEAIDDSL